MFVLVAKVPSSPPAVAAVAAAALPADVPANRPPAPVLPEKEGRWWYAAESGLKRALVL